MLYLTTDHLGTPVLATDASGGVVWQGGFEPFGADYSGAFEAGVFLRFPGQWVDATWSDSKDLNFNVHRWYLPQSGRYTRADPLGPLRALMLAHVYAYARTNPLLFFDPLGLDEVTGDSNIQDCFFCMLKAANFGMTNFEKAAWIIQDESGTLACVTEGWVSHRGKAAWPAGFPRPSGNIAIAHTHPTRSPQNRSQPEPSANDRDTADNIRLPIYTITPQGIWKYDPETMNITQEASANWEKGPRKRCKKDRCEELLQ